MTITMLICAAIRSRTLLVFEYDGHARIVAPYCHGSNANGELLRAVQVGGTSRSGSFGIGKLWKVDRMKNLRATETLFSPDDPDYNPDDSAMHSIHCRV